jgi:phosphate transport system substrate-binding protein
MRTKLSIFGIAILTVFLSSCAQPPASGDGQPGQTQNINLKGSDTMLQLGQRWAEAYMKEHPGTTIQVTGGGSGTGIAALTNGTTEICQSSRPMKDEEKATIKQNRKADVVETPVAVDALAIYVNKKNKIEKITMEQLKGIYQGKIANWKDVGGDEGSILLYGRENNSGTYVFFKEEVLGNEDFVDRYQPLAGTAGVINAIVKDVSGIGYGGIGYATDVKAIPVAKDAKSEPVAPTMENALSNKYPLSRFLFWYTAGAPTGAIKEFVDWVVGPQGQSVVKDVGFYPMKDSTAAAQ